MPKSLNSQSNGCGVLLGGVEEKEEVKERTREWVSQKENKRVGKGTLHFLEGSRGF